MDSKGISMIIPTLFVSALLTVPRVRFAVWLAVFGSLVALLLLAWCITLSSDARKSSIMLCTTIIPLILLAFIWPQFQLPICASLAALMSLSCFSRRNRRALRVLLILFVGFMPFFLLIGIGDASWSAGFLLVYLGLTSLQPEIADEGHADGARAFPPNLATETRYCIYHASLGFLWILLFAALLWYIPDSVTGM